MVRHESKIFLHYTNRVSRKAATIIVNALVDLMLEELAGRVSFRERGSASVELSVSSPLESS
jgi:hypothetical protein